MFDLILSNVNRHVTLTGEETEIFTGLLQVKKLRKHQYLVQEGDVSRFEFFINKGATRSFYVDAKGNEHVVMFGVEDWWTGDMYSFLTQRPARYQVITEEATEFHCLDRSSIDTLYHKVPKFERFFRILIQNAYIAQQERVIASMSQSAEERYQSFVKRYPQLERRFPQYQVASYLGIKPESLSRIRQRIARSS